LRKASQKQRGFRGREEDGRRTTGMVPGSMPRFTQATLDVLERVHVRIPARLFALFGERRAYPTRFCTGRVGSRPPSGRTDYAMPELRVTYDHSDAAILDEALSLANTLAGQDSPVEALAVLGRQSVGRAAGRLGRSGDLAAARDAVTRALAEIRPGSCGHCARRLEGASRDGLCDGCRNRDRDRLCPGPTRGQSCRIPLDVLEARLAELLRAYNPSFGREDGECSWFRHRIARERARLVRLGLRAPDPAPHVCRQRDLDYVPGDRRRVRCSVCGLERRAD
jgi:hypothetical protein